MSIGDSPWRALDYLEDSNVITWWYATALPERSTWTPILTALSLSVDRPSVLDYSAKVLLSKKAILRNSATTDTVTKRTAVKLKDE